MPAAPGTRRPQAGLWVVAFEHRVTQIPQAASAFRALSAVDLDADGDLDLV